MKVVAVLSVVLVTVLLLPPPASPLRHYAGKLPDGHDVTFYLHLCSVCGEFYGGPVERDCILDKTFHTFYNCQAAILQRRRK